jgi:hypothetical protein
VSPPSPTPSVQPGVAAEHHAARPRDTWEWVSSTTRPLRVFRPAAPRPPMRVVGNMPEISNNGVRIVYNVVGEGRPLMLLHGWCADRARRPTHADAAMSKLDSGRRQLRRTPHRVGRHCAGRPAQTVGKIDVPAAHDGVGTISSPAATRECATCLARTLRQRGGSRARNLGRVASRRCLRSAHHHVLTHTFDFEPQCLCAK